MRGGRHHSYAAKANDLELKGGSTSPGQVVSIAVYADRLSNSATSRSPHDWR